MCGNVGKERKTQKDPLCRPRLTQKFRTPISSREASWKDNPDDSALGNRITIKLQANCEWKKHMVHLHNVTQDLQSMC